MEKERKPRESKNAPMELRALRANIDWSALRFPGEADFQRELAADAQAYQAMLNRSAELHSARCRGNRAGLPATRQLCPSLHRIAAELTTVLRIEPALELSVYRSREWVIDDQWDDEAKVVRLAISSSLINETGVDTRRFLIGRAIGRFLFDQAPLEGDPLAGEIDPPQSNLPQRALWRFQQLSCDRVGLFCCQDVVAAARAILQELSGVSAELLLSDEAAVWRECELVSHESAIFGSSEFEFALLRMRALKYFFDSERYQGAFDRGAKPGVKAKGTVKPLLKSDGREVARRVAGIPSDPVASLVATDSKQSFEVEQAEPQTVASNPSPINADSVFDRLQLHIETLKAMQDQLTVSKEPAGENRIRTSSKVGAPTVSGDDIGKFTLYASLWIVCQKDDITSAEYDLFVELFGERALKEAAEFAERGDEDRFYQVCAELAPLVRKLGRVERWWVAQQLVRVATADDILGPRENDVLLDLCEMIGISADELEQIASHDLPAATMGCRGVEYRSGQEVEVQLDGHWLAGFVESVDREGDLHVRFTADGKLLHLNPTADLIRPVITRQAG